MLTKLRARNERGAAKPEPFDARSRVLFITYTRRSRLGRFAARPEDAFADVAPGGGAIAEFVQELEPTQVGRPELGRDSDAAVAKAQGKAEEADDKRVGGVLQGRTISVGVAVEPQAAAFGCLVNSQRR